MCGVECVSDNKYINMKKKLKNKRELRNKFTEA